jgi:hypothetical protein
MGSERDQFLTDVIRSLTHRDACIDGSGHGAPGPPWPLTPASYLDFARSDFARAGAHGWVNALGNAKRALHCQVDALLYALGLFEVAGREGWRFPQKIDVLTEAGIVTPNTLRRLNTARNAVEHEYAVPSGPTELEAYIDTVELFVRATRRLAHFDLIEFAFPDEAPLEWASIAVSRESATARVRGAPGPFSGHGIEVASTDLHFRPLVVKAMSLVERDSW